MEKQGSGAGTHRTGSKDDARSDAVTHSVLDRLRHLRPVLLGGLSVVVLIAAWDLAVRFELVNPVFVPSPLSVARALATLFSGSQIWVDLRVSGEEFAVGLSLAILIGGVLGILTGLYRPLEELFRPIVVGINATPMVAVIPILILIFGIGMAPKVIVVIIICGIIIIMNTAAGVANADEALVRLSRSFGASDWQLIRTIIVPSIVPFFMTGVRLSVGHAVIAVIVGEIFASRAGIGNLLIASGNAFDMPVMFASVFIMTALGIALTQGAMALEGRMSRWKA